VRTADHRVPGDPKICIDPNWLREAYTVRGMSCAEIGREVGASPKTVNSRLHALGIPVRAPGPTGGRQDPYGVPDDVLTKKYLSEAFGTKRLTRRQVAQQTGFSEPTVLRHARRHGVAVPSQTLDIDRWRLAELVDQGRTIAEIAADLGCGLSTVRRRLGDHGLSTKPPRQKFPIDADELACLVAAGWTQRQMAEHFGCGRTTVVKRLIRYGLQTTTRG
jgi:DNA-binding CsgD family transcriptional regulator